MPARVVLLLLPLLLQQLDMVLIEPDNATITTAPAAIPACGFCCIRHSCQPWRSTAYSHIHGCHAGNAGDEQANEPSKHAKDSDGV